ncbi:hypothetical protein EVAR_90664_1 [Eumeta japonica]|uniref:Uncharacterized protein n=1 Tax=Eumeta variegata TaxID=151549 RepID=A0A4C1Z9A7_EUMVA|nr:hypothetical protein EVAR_90664_1 [Eumeta japonica]
MPVSSAQFVSNDESNQRLYLLAAGGLRRDAEASQKHDYIDAVTFRSVIESSCGPLLPPSSHYPFPYPSPLYPLSPLHPILILNPIPTQDADVTQRLWHIMNEYDYDSDVYVKLLAPEAVITLTPAAVDIPQPESTDPGNPMSQYLTPKRKDCGGVASCHSTRRWDEFETNGPQWMQVNIECHKTSCVSKYVSLNDTFL